MLETRGLAAIPRLGTDELAHFGSEAAGHARSAARRAVRTPVLHGRAPGPGVHRPLHAAPAPPWKELPLAPRSARHHGGPPPRPPAPAPLRAQPLQGPAGRPVHHRPPPGVAAR